MGEAPCGVVVVTKGLVPFWGKRLAGRFPKSQKPDILYRDIICLHMISNILKIALYMDIY
ncbi:MAG TPA: hypothetical protein VFK40_03895 [Nitrososphaeraceae archaeon]|nr:hypothetical protein [Nitrososphaeraceae archaeon]HET8794236.1 hypothetical protein [Nitrososphaeraceae archaeon]HJT84674.1 hypothetical protein [Nitrososphaeraceae archaeon]